VQGFYDARLDHLNSLVADHRLRKSRQPLGETLRRRSEREDRDLDPSGPLIARAFKLFSIHKSCLSLPAVSMHRLARRHELLPYRLQELLCIGKRLRSNREPMVEELVARRKDLSLKFVKVYNETLGVEFSSSKRDFKEPGVSVDRNARTEVPPYVMSEMNEDAVGNLKHE